MLDVPMLDLAPWWCWRATVGGKWCRRQRPGGGATDIPEKASLLARQSVAIMREVARVALSRLVNTASVRAHRNDRPPSR